MKVLVIGDEHTYGYGLTKGNLSYVGHFIRQLKRAGQAVSVEAYAHLTLEQVLSTIAHLPLSHYDLIIFQLDQLLLQPVSKDLLNVPCLAIPTLPYSLVPKPGSGVSGLRYWSALIRDMTRSVSQSVGAPALPVLLKQLRPYQHNVLIVTPIPHQSRMVGWLRQRVRTLWLREAKRKSISVFDTNTVIRPQSEFFLPDDADHLSAVGHELLGRSLFDFYISAPTIITIQAIRRDMNF